MNLDLELVPGGLHIFDAQGQRIAMAPADAEAPLAAAAAPALAAAGAR